MGHRNLHRNWITALETIDCIFAGGDEVVRPFSNPNTEVKHEPAQHSTSNFNVQDRNSPGPGKGPGGRKPNNTSAKGPDSVNGYSTNSPQNAADDAENAGSGGGSGVGGGRGAKARKPRAVSSAAAKERDRRTKAQQSAPVAPTPTSSTASSSEEAEESDNEATGGANAAGAGGRSKKPGAAAKDVLSKSSAGGGRGSQARQRSSDSSSSSKEGQAPRKGGRGVAASNVNSGNTKSGNNPFNKPPVAQLKKTGESFLQVIFQTFFQRHVLFVTFCGFLTYR